MRLFGFLCGLFAAALSGCSSPQSRIDSNRAAFEKYPAEVQGKIRVGRVEVGFTPEMVRMALGEPARQLNRKTEKGELEIWVYTDDRPQFSFGFGVGSASRHSAMGLGMETSSGGYELDEKARIVFSGGVVESIEYRKN